MKLFLFIPFLLLLGCSSSKNVMETNTKSKALDELVTKKHFKIISDWASPRASSGLNSVANSGLLGVGNSGTRINLIGNTNFLKIEGDTLTADLPYYGERQMGGGYTSETGIKFKGVPKVYQETKDSSSQQHRITFQISEGTESFGVSITLFPNWSSLIVVNSSQRSAISYQGNVQEISDKK